MITMNEKQKTMFDELSDNLLHAKSRNEIEYYSEKIHMLLDEVEVDSPKEEIFTQEQLELYHKYKQELLNARTSKDITFYESKIMNLIDSNEIRRKKEN